VSDFDKAERPKGRDHYTEFRANVGAYLAYRDAYIELAATDPARALTLPHPDDHGLDPVKALELLRGAGGPLRTDGVVDLKG
jgi:hypothetical protein